ncbi:hypothetical protein V6N13_094127 [Hibiscus sabdariffa]
MSLKNPFLMNRQLMPLELIKTSSRKHLDDILDVSCLMLATMTPELQKQRGDMVIYKIIQNLKEIFERQAYQEMYKTSKALFQCKMSNGSPMGAHVMGYIQTLEKLGFPLKDELATDDILQSFAGYFQAIRSKFHCE